MEILSKYGNVKVEISGSSSVLWGNILGMLSNQTDLQNALNAKQDTLTLTTTGTSGAATLVGATLNIPQYSGGGSSSITIGTTAITSGTVGRVLFEGTGNVVQESANLFWDETNNRLGVGTSTPLKALTVKANAFDDGFLLESGAGQTLFQVTRDGLSVATSELFMYANGAIRFAIRSLTNFSYFNGGNFGFGTTTDAGFRLDVNGTARFNASSGNDIITDATNVTLNGYASSGSVVRFQSRNAAAALLYKLTIPNNTNTAAIFNGGLRFTNLPTSSAVLSAGDIWNDAGTLKIV